MTLFLHLSFEISSYIYIYLSEFVFMHSVLCPLITLPWILIVIHGLTNYVNNFYNFLISNS